MSEPIDFDLVKCFINRRNEYLNKIETEVGSIGENIIIRELSNFIDSLSYDYCRAKEMNWKIVSFRHTNLYFLETKEAQKILFEALTPHIFLKFKKLNIKYSYNKKENKISIKTSELDKLYNKYKALI